MSEPTGFRLPVEICLLVCGHTSFDDLRRLAVVSPDLWSAAAPRLWRNVPGGVNTLFALMVGRQRTQTENEETWPDCIEEAEFQRFERIARFVRCLSLQGPSRSPALIKVPPVGETWLRYLEGKAETGPLLPNLETYVLGGPLSNGSLVMGLSSSDWGFGPRALRLFRLFLCPSIIRLTICHHSSAGALDPHLVASRTPNLRRLEVFYTVPGPSDPSPDAVVDAATASHGWVDGVGHAMHAWATLSSLVVGNTLLTRDTSRAIGLLPALTDLRIVRTERGAQGQEFLSSDDSSFPTLNSLALDLFAPWEVLPYVHWPNLLRRVEAFYWIAIYLEESTRPQIDPSTALDAVLGRLADAPCLQVVHVTNEQSILKMSVASTSVGLSRLLASPTLELVYMDGITSGAGLELALTRYRSTLPELHLPDADIPFAALAAVASSFPMLSLLHIGLSPILEAEANALVWVPRPVKASNKRVRLVSDFSHAAIASGMTRPQVRTVIHRLSHFILSLWPEVDLRHLAPGSDGMEDSPACYGRRLDDMVCALQHQRLLYWEE